jgi:threonine aldolase
VDLRSDTVTRPTQAMRAAIAEAEVGDDQDREDPTINALEAEVAALFGHEAALFVPSGTMGNQLALRTLLAPGDELLCDTDAHIVSYEAGAAAAVGGISTRTVAGVPTGALDVDAVLAQVRVPGYHMSPTTAVAVENTHNRAGGAVQPLDVLRRLRAATQALGVALHCDGARIWNAHIASGVPLHEYGALFDTLSVCLSKGLGAAGRYALAHHLERLADDHRRAARLAEALTNAALSNDDGLGQATAQTNFVVLDVPDAHRFIALAAERGVLTGALGPHAIRLVTHLDVDDADIDKAADVLLECLRT